MAEAENQPPANVAVDALQNSLAALRMEMRAGRLGRQISQFNGDGTRRYRDWVQDVERVGHAINANDDSYRSMCLETLKGPALEQFTRLLRENPNVTWAQIRQGLNAVYLDAADGYIAIQRLHRTKQRKGESIHSYTERLRALAEEGYLGQDMAQPHIQDVMIEALIQGVYEPKIAKALIRNRPNNFAGAVGIANREHTASKHFNVRRGGDEEEPMEVDAINRKQITQLERKLEALTNQLAINDEKKKNPQPAEKVFSIDEKLEFLLTKINSLENQKKLSENRKRVAATTTTAEPYKWTADGKPICAHCGLVGHIRAYCRKRRRMDYQNNTRTGSGN